MSAVPGISCKKTVIWIAFIIFLIQLTTFITTVAASNRRPRWCSTLRYPHPSGLCLLCYKYCHISGCTGPSPFVGPGGCRNCDKAIVLNSTHTKCIVPTLQGCPPRFYLRRMPNTPALHLAGADVCRRCHPWCETCQGPGIPNCLTCRYYTLYNYCVNRCPPGTRTYESSRRCYDPTNNRYRTLARFIYNMHHPRTTTTAP